MLHYSNIGLKTNLTDFFCDIKTFFLIDINCCLHLNSLIGGIKEVCRKAFLLHAMKQTKIRSSRFD